MEVTGATKSLTGSNSVRGVFSRVMHENDREVELTLQGAEVGQELSHLARAVLVDSVKSHERIEYKQAWPQTLRRLEQSSAVWITIQPESGGRDHVDFDRFEMKSPMSRHSRYALTYDRQRVLGKVDQYRAWLVHGILAQAGSAAGYA
jgi:hypothetical protein